MFASAERIELAAVWDELIAGTCKVESWSHTDDTWSMVVTRRPQPGRTPTPLRARDVEILEQALSCGVRKIVASEVKLSCSSIAVIMQSCFHYMGVSCLPSRIPGLLVAACHARRQQGPKFRPYPRLVKDGRFLSQTITVPRPDAALKPWLAPAEHAVISLLIEGQSYAEIAKERQTSIRTVANQVASGFRRLGVSGRAELLCLLARWAFEPPAPPAKRPPSLVPANGRKAISRGSALAAAVEPEQSFSPSPAT